MRIGVADALTLIDCLTPLTLTLDFQSISYTSMACQQSGTLKREMTFHDFPSKGFLRLAVVELDMVRFGNRNQELLRKEQQRQDVLEILRDNREGLTSTEITIRVGHLARMRLLELREEGKVIQKKGYAKDGKVTYLYALTREMSIKGK